MFEPNNGEQLPEKIKIGVSACLLGKKVQIRRWSQTQPFYHGRTGGAF